LQISEQQIELMRTTIQTEIRNRVNLRFSCSVLSYATARC